MQWQVAPGGVLLYVLATPIGCVLYTDPVNEPPVVERLLPDDRTGHMGDTRVLTALLRDQDDGPGGLRLEWQHWSGDCGSRPPLAQRRAPVAGATYSLQFERLGPLCVLVRAVDHDGAADELAEVFRVINRRPLAMLELAPAPGGARAARLHSIVELVADRSEDRDNDPLSYTWAVLGPDAKPREVHPCRGRPAASRRCLSADQPGTYRATVVVSDGTEHSAPAELTFTTDEDRPPCLEETDPPFLQSSLVIIPRGTRRLFEVLRADDDGEPFPAVPGRPGEARFVWSTATEQGAFTRLLGRNGPRLEIGEPLFDSPRPGDQFRVRVEVRDQRLEQQLEARSIGPACPEREPVCAVDRCVRWATWKVQFYP